MNTISIVGRLTKDPELSKTSGGISLCRFTVASKGKNKDEDGNAISDFFLCVAWREKADTIQKYCKKGNQIQVIGSMGSRNYEDQNGVKRQIWECNVTDVEFLTTKSENGGEQSKPKQAKQTSKGKAVQQTLTPIEVDDENLPF